MERDQVPRRHPQAPLQWWSRVTAALMSSGGDLILNLLPGGPDSVRSLGTVPAEIRPIAVTGRTPRRA